MTNWPFLKTSTREEVAPCQYRRTLTLPLLTLSVPDGNGIIEAYDFYTILVADVDRSDVIISVTMTDQTDPQITASLDVTAVIFVKRICFGDTCDPGQTCVNGFCELE